jgi:decaprenyl-phosphate phosphoribosyltransferase
MVPRSSRKPLVRDQGRAHTSSDVIRALFEAGRPRQWVKNLFVAAPLVFSKNLTDGREVALALAAALLFCLLSSAVYIWNDVIDVERDRAHPKKRHRPIASGRLPVNIARVAAATLAAGSLAVSLLLGWGFAYAAAGYLTINFAYSLYLKRVVYLDVLAISAGFILRVIAGALAIAVHASPYLLLCTALLSCFLGFGKRAHELKTAGERAHEQRPVLLGYRHEVLRAALYLTSGATLVAYVLYCRAPHTLEFFHTTKMVWTAPFAAFGLLRFLQIVRGTPDADSPTEAMLRDTPFLVNLMLWAAAIVIIIYYG